MPITPPLTVVEGLQEWREGEQLPFTLDLSLWPNPPTNPTVEVIRLRDGVDVTASVMPGSASVSANTVILPVLINLVVGTRYRVTVTYQAGAGVYKPYFDVVAVE